MSNLVFDRFASTLTEGEWLSVDYRMGTDTDSDNPNLTVWDITLLRCKESSFGDAESLPVAVAKFVVADVDNVDEWDHRDVYAAFDAYSESTETVASATVHHWMKNHRMVIVDEVTVEPDYRGHGLGPMLVVEALTKLGIHRMQALVLLQSGSFDHESMTPEEEIEAAEVISRSWERAGFNRVDPLLPGNFSIMKADEISIKGTEARVMSHLTRSTLVAV
jgi:GNAT superfamily N-acetyltransferase